MSTCTEIAVFKVPQENMAQVIALSLVIFEEINRHDTLITAHEILQKTDNPEELCWHLTWASKDAVQLSKEKWSSYSGTKALESLVGEKIYYGHFMPMG